MRVTRTFAAVLAAVVAWSIPTQAHHSISMFDIATPIWVKGALVRLERVNPHAIITLDERKTGGQIQRWAIEGTSPMGLARAGFDTNALKMGDVIEVCGFALKAEHTRPTSPVSDSSARFVHGQLLLSNGHMQMWGSYGKLQNCIRPTDQQQSWLDFLNEDSRARTVWCNRWLDSTPSPAFAMAFAKEITGRMAHPCE